MQYGVVQLSEPIHIRLNVGGTQHSILSEKKGWIIVDIGERGLLVGHKRQPELAEVVPWSRVAHALCKATFEEARKFYLKVPPPELVRVKKRAFNKAAGE